MQNCSHSTHKIEDFICFYCVVLVDIKKKKKNIRQDTADFIRQYQEGLLLGCDQTVKICVFLVLVS